MNLEPPSLIKYAMDQIDHQTFQNMMEKGKKTNLSDLEKGRIIVDFMNKKSKPFENRHFYKHFFTEHDKAEKLTVLQGFTDKINKVIRENDEKEKNSGGNKKKQEVSSLKVLKKYVQDVNGIKNLNLGADIRKKILKQLHDEELKNGMKG